MPVCVRLVTRPRPYLAGIIFALVLSGVYTIGITLFDVGIVLFAGLAGYLIRAMFSEALAKHDLKPRMDEVYQAERAALPPARAEG